MPGASRRGKEEPNAFPLTAKSHFSFTISIAGCILQLQVEKTSTRPEYEKVCLS
jgi:hypothetical protein